MPSKKSDYSKCVIYKIQHVDDDSLLYVGNTTRFDKRKSHHKCTCNDPKYKGHNQKLYKMIRDNGGWDCFEMTQIKEFPPCKNSREAEAEEDKIMIRAHLTVEEKKETCSKYQKEWRETNHKEVIDKHRKYNDRSTHKEEAKAYREANKEDIKKRDKKYREANKEKKKESDRLYREANKEAIKAKRSQKVMCECGCEVTKIHLSRHKKSQAHLSFFE